jgi:LemA protein
LSVTVILVGIVVGLSVLFGLTVVLIYNNLVRRRNLVQEGWSGIDVQLKRRVNLIPNLVETVRGYARHEKSLLKEVVELRAASIDASTVAEQGHVEGLLGAALGRLFAVAEAYPDLKASSNFQNLQRDLSVIEDDIQKARRYYNGTVRNLNILVESFPSNLIANTFRFLPAEYFEIEEETDRRVPKVSFDEAAS